MAHHFLARTFALAALTLLLAAACTSGDDATPTATPEATPTSSATPAPTATRVPPREPTFAPDGRTGFAEVDAFIETVLTGDADTLAALYAGEGLRYCGGRVGADQQADLSADEWPLALATSARSLYAVAIGNQSPINPTAFSVVFAVATEGDPAEGWSFRIEREQVVSLEVGCNTPPSVYTPGVASDYPFFLVLPPAEDLPQRPPGHPLSVRTGLAEVDTLIEALETAGPDALLALVEYETEGPVDALPGRDCLNESIMRDQSVVERQLPSLAAPGTTVHGVSVVPNGFRVQADYTVILVHPGNNPYDWTSDSLYLRAGRIVQWDVGCGERVESLYPPFAYLVLPRAAAGDASEGSSGGSYDGDSGVAVVDKALAAIAAHDLDTLTSVIDWRLVGCLEPGVSLGIGQPPYCEGDEQPGDLVGTLTFAFGESVVARPDNAIAALEILLQADWEVYAIADLGQPRSDLESDGRYQVILTGDTPNLSPVRSLLFTSDGLRLVSGGDGPIEPRSLLYPGNTPDFLLAPPAE